MTVPNNIRKLALNTCVAQCRKASKEMAAALRNGNADLEAAFAATDATVSKAVRVARAHGVTSAEILEALKKAS